MTGFAMVRVCRLHAEKPLQLAIEVSSDGGQTWALLPTQGAVDEYAYPTALQTGKGRMPAITTSIAILSTMGGSIELEHVARPEPDHEDGGEQ